MAFENMGGKLDRSGRNEGSLWTTDNLKAIIEAGKAQELIENILELERQAEAMQTLDWNLDDAANT
jgi:hypothetical protein